MENGGLPASKAYLLVIRGTTLQCWTSTVGSTLKTECWVQNTLVKPLVLDVIAMRKFVLQLKPGKNSSHDLQRLRTRAKVPPFFTSAKLFGEVVSYPHSSLTNSTRLKFLALLSDSVFARGRSHYRPKPWGFKDHKTICLLSFGV